MLKSEQVKEVRRGYDGIRRAICSYCRARSGGDGCAKDLLKACASEMALIAEHVDSCQTVHSEGSAMIDQDDELLDMIAQQARAAYAQQQLEQFQATLQQWQGHAEHGSNAFSDKRVQHELAYYAQQIIRWQTYLTNLAP